jgi:virginiamycin B lyase
VVTEFTIGITPGAKPAAIATGPDGNLWFAEFLIDRIARITTAGEIVEFSAGISPVARPEGIAAGADGMSPCSAAFDPTPRRC